MILNFPQIEKHNGIVKIYLKHKFAISRKYTLLGEKLLNHKDRVQGHNSKLGHNLANDVQRANVDYAESGQHKSAEGQVTGVREINPSNTHKGNRG